MLRAVAMTGHVDRRCRNATLGHQTARTSHDLGSLLVPPADLSHQDQRTSTGGPVWHPQHTGNLTDDKELFADAAGRRLGIQPHSTHAPR
jgi:hypothetical protein